ncbi:MAG: heavy-metal-associated domain-containing protein [Luteibaculaceae bacterium]
MKTLFNILASLGLFFGLNANTQAQQIETTTKGKVTESTFWVNGNCNMCKKRIEKALEVNGIKTADYNPETKNLFVAFRNDKITMEEIHSLINAAGHDTRLGYAPKEVYENLHHCCVYEREPLKNE